MIADYQNESNIKRYVVLKGVIMTNNELFHIFSLSKNVIYCKQGDIMCSKYLKNAVWSNSFSKEHSGVHDFCNNSLKEVDIAEQNCLFIRSLGNENQTIEWERTDQLVKFCDVPINGLGDCFIM